MTPVYKINMKGANPLTGSGQVWAKMERENPTGTHKDRSIAPWISHYVKQGIREFAIASSGNSAISAIKYCAENNLTLHVFVSLNSIALPYLRRKVSGLYLYTSKTPRKDAIRFCLKNGVVNLRASTDDHALIGYRNIALELIRQLPKIDNIFIPTSSGATLIGIRDGFLERVPSLFVVQTAKVHPIASYFDKEFESEKTSYAAAIVDNIAHRRNCVIKICQETGGGGFVISNNEIEEAKKNLCSGGWQSHAPHGAWQSALAFAGFLKWRSQNPKESDGKVSVCLFTD